MKQRYGYVYGIALLGLLFAASPVFAQDVQPQQGQGGGGNNGQFFCNSLGRMANAQECDTADKAKGFSGNTQQQGDNNQQSQRTEQMRKCNTGERPTRENPCMMDENSMRDMQKQDMQKNDMGQQKDQNQMRNDTRQNENQKFDQRGNSMQDRNSSFEDMRGNNMQGGDRGQQGDHMMDRGNQDEFQGPSEEEMQKQEAKMNEQRFRQMKQGLSQFKNGMKGMKKNVTSMKKNLDKCGVSLPEELTAALNNSDAIVQKLDAAKTADDLDEVMSDAQDVGSVMQEWGPKLGDLMRICEMMKRSDADYKNMERNINRIIKQADAAKKKMDLSDMTGALKEELAKLKEAKDSAKTLAKTDPEEALTKLEDEFYGEFDNLNNAQQELETVLNITKGLRDGKNEVKRYDSQLKSLKKQKKDTSELESDLKDIKQKMAGLESFMKQKGMKADELVDKVQELFDLREQFLDKLDELTGGNGFQPQIKGGQGFNFQLPQGFEKQSKNEDMVPQGGGSSGDMMQNF